jgi:hypothetical protein
MKLEDWHRWWKRTGAQRTAPNPHEEWDPTGVRGVPEAADEDGYLGSLAARLREGASAEVIADYLTEVEEDRMGLGESAISLKWNQALAARLRTWHDRAMASGNSALRCATFPTFDWRCCAI